MTTMIPVDSKLYIESDTVTDVAPEYTTKPSTLAPLKRPLSAYNIYFQLESKRLMEGESVRAFTLNDAIKICDEQRTIRKLPKTLRKRRKAHARFPFEQMARVIAGSWKALDKNMRKVFEDCAALEKKKYLQEKKFLNAGTVAKGIEASPVAERKVQVTESEGLLSILSTDGVEDGRFLSEATPATPSVSEYQDLIMDDLEPIGYKQTSKKEEHDLSCKTNQNLLFNLEIIKEQQERLRVMEYSLKSLIIGSLQSQKIGNRQTRKGFVSPLKARKIDKRMTSMKPLDNWAILKNEGLHNKLPMQRYGNDANKTNMNECLLEDVNDCIFDRADDIFNVVDNPLLCSTRMNSYGFCNINDCFNDLYGCMEATDDSIYDLDLVNNEGLFSELTSKSHGQGSTDFDMNYCANSSYSGREDADNFVFDLADDICDVADNSTLFSSYRMSTEELLSKEELFIKPHMQSHIHGFIPSEMNDCL